MIVSCRLPDRNPKPQTVFVKRLYRVEFRFPFNLDTLSQLLAGVRNSCKHCAANWFQASGSRGLQSRGFATVGSGRRV